MRGEILLVVVVVVDRDALPLSVPCKGLILLKLSDENICLCGMNYNR
jgi:hypothetical protein